MQGLTRLILIKYIIAILLSLLLVFNLSFAVMAKGKPYVEKKSAPVTVTVTADVTESEEIVPTDTAAIKDEDTARASGIPLTGFNHSWLIVFLLISIILKRSLDALQESNEE